MSCRVRCQEDSLLQLRACALREAHAALVLDPRADGKLSRHEAYVLLKECLLDLPTDDDETEGLPGDLPGSDRSGKVPFDRVACAALQGDAGLFRDDAIVQLIAALYQRDQRFWRGGRAHLCRSADQRGLRRSETVLWLQGEDEGCCSSWKRTVTVDLAAPRIDIRWDVLVGSWTRSGAGLRSWTVPRAGRCTWTAHIQLSQAAVHSRSCPGHLELDPTGSGWHVLASSDSGHALTEAECDTEGLWEDVTAQLTQEPADDDTLALAPGTLSQLRVLLEEHWWTALPPPARCTESPTPPQGPYAHIGSAYSGGGSAAADGATQEATPLSVWQEAPGGGDGDGEASEHESAKWSVEERDESRLQAAVRRYCRLLDRCPLCLVAAYLLAAAVLVVSAWRPFSLDTDFSNFVDADGPAHRRQQAYVLAKASQQGLVEDGGRRRLAQEDWLAPAAAVKQESVRTARRAPAAPALGSPPPAAVGAADGGRAALRGAGRLGQVAAARWSGSRQLAADAALYVEQQLTVIYAAKGGDALDPRFLEEVRGFEEALRGGPMWKALCSRATTTGDSWRCEPGESFAAMAWASHSAPRDNASSFDLLFDARGGELFALPALFAHMARAFEAGAEGYDPKRYFPKEFQMPDVEGGEWPPKVPLAAVRSRFSFYLRIGTDSDSGDQIRAAKDDMTNMFESMIKDEVYPLLKSSAGGYKYTRIYYSGDQVGSHEIELTLLQDLHWAIGSVLFVAVYAFFHTRSLLLPIGSLIAISAAVPVAYVLTPGSRTTIASFLAVFLIAGIGVDAVFIFSDAWQQGAHLKEVDSRLMFAIGHGGRCALAASLTTSLSFFANLASSLKALRDFSLFMGLCVVSAFVLTILVVPPLLVLQDRRRRRRTLQRTVDISLGEVGTLAVVPAPLHRAPTGPDSQQVSRKYAVLFNAVTLLARCPVLIIVLAVIAVVLFLICSGSGVQLARGLPEVFPADSNQVAGAAMAAKFHTVFALQGMPDESALACRPDGMGAGHASSRCALNWCSAPPANPAEDAFQYRCWREQTAVLAPDGNRSAAGWGVDKCSSVAFLNRFAARPDTKIDAWARVWRDIAVAAFQTANYTLGPGVLANTSVVSTALPPLVLETWETGAVSISPFHEASRMEFGVSADGAAQRAACEIATICFVGRQRCELPATWRQFHSFLLQRYSLPWSRMLAASPALVEPTVPIQKRIEVTVTFGIRATRRTPAVGAQGPAWSFDPDFGPQDPWAQRAILAICTELTPELRVLEAQCWIALFRAWLLSSPGHRFPSRDFDADLATWYMQNPLMAKRDLWMVNRRLAACLLTFTINLADDVSAQEALEQAARWDAYLLARNRAASVAANGAVQTAPAWVQAEAEVAVVSSTQLTIVLAAISGGVGVFVLTCDLWLTLLVVLVVLSIISGTAFFIITVMGWQVGAIEALGLVVFVGYSATYPLHVAHTYAVVREDDHDLLAAEVRAAKLRAADSQASAVREEDIDTRLRSPAALRLARTRVAVIQAGGAIIGSAISTLGSGFFLLFCTLNVFVKLGAVIMAATFISVVFALLVLPALLMLCGTGPMPLHQRIVQSVLREVSAKLEDERLRRRRTHVQLEGGQLIG